MSTLLVLVFLLLLLFYCIEQLNEWADNRAIMQRHRDNRAARAHLLGELQAQDRHQQALDALTDSDRVWLQAMGWEAPDGALRLPPQYPGNGTFDLDW